MRAGDIAGRAAVVTGAGKGIGRAVTLALCAAGARVAAVSRSSRDLDSLASESAGAVLPCAGDVSCEADVSRVFDVAVSELGPVTILVAAAGVARFGDTLDLPVADWHEQIATNLTGMYFSNLAAIREMLPAGFGDIVNVLSLSSTLALPGSAAYTASKFGGLGLTRALSAEFRSRGIRISAVMPGATDTSLWDALGSEPDRGRMLRPADVAEAVLWTLRQPESASVDEIRIMPREGVL